MSKMAILESGQGEKELQITARRPFAYVLIQIIKGFFVGTICFCAIFLFWFCMQWDDLNIVFASADFLGFFEEWIHKFVIFIGGYMLLCAVVAGARYYQCSRRKKKFLYYMRQLKKASRQAEDTESKIYAEEQ